MVVSGGKLHKVTKYNQFRLKLLSILLVLVVSLNATDVQAFAPFRQTGDTLQECDVVSEDELQAELNRVTQQVFATALDQVDITAIVDAQWQLLAIDAVIDAEVDRAVARVRGEKDLWDTFLSGWSAGKAQELTRAVAVYTFEAEGFQTKIDELSAGVANELAQEIALLSAQSVSQAFYCLQTFISGNYSQALLRTFENEVQTATESVDFAGADAFEPGILSVLDQHKTALGGVGVIIAAQVAKRIVVNIGRTISERVAGKIVGRVIGKAGSTIIPIAGWLIGAGLIAYDVYSSRDGALPQIQESLKSVEVKSAIRGEIVGSVEPEFRRELPQVARDISNELFNEWRNVKRNIRQVLELADENPNFNAILSGLDNQTELAKLVNLVGIALPALGEDGFTQAVNNGLLARVLAQPESSFQIIVADKSLDSAIAWSEVAGTAIDQVVEFEIYKHKSPDAISRSLLDQLVAVDNRAAIEKLVLLDSAAIEALLTVSSSNLATLATRLSADELLVLAGYLPRLGQDQKNQLVTRVMAEPALLQRLADPAVQERIVASADIDATLAFLASPQSLAGLYADLTEVFFGRVSIPLVAYKYGLWPTIGIGAGLLLLLLIVLRLIYAFFVWLISPVTRLVKR